MHKESQVILNQIDVRVINPMLLSLLTVCGKDIFHDISFIVIIKSFTDVRNLITGFAGRTDWPGHSLHVHPLWNSIRKHWMQKNISFTGKKLFFNCWTYTVVFIHFLSGSPKYIGSSV